MHCTPAATPATDSPPPPLPSRGGGGAASGARRPKAERARRGPAPEPGGRDCVPTRRRQGDEDVTQAAWFGMFGRRRSLLGNARQARSQGPALRHRHRTPVRAVLAGSGSEPPSAIPEGCRVPVLTQVAVPPGTNLPMLRLLPSSYSLSLPVSQVCLPVPIFTAIILPQASIHPPFRTPLP